MDLYKILGVSRTASGKEIRRAYLELAKILHPDAGGSAEEFQMLQFAYATLNDHAKRTHYDATGETTVGPDPEEIFQNNVLSLLNVIVSQVVLNSDLSPFDNMQVICLEMCDLKLQEIDNTASALRNAEKKVRRVVKRWKRKTPGKQDFVAGLLNQKLEEIRRKITIVKTDRKIVTAAREIMADYDFTVAKPKPKPEPKAKKDEGRYQIKRITSTADFERFLRGEI